MSANLAAVSAGTIDGMRTIHIACIAALGLVGCAASSVSSSHGETLREYAGGIPVVFTNATPDRMCGLYMSADDVLDYGDNWLPLAGLTSGASVELRVKPGTYKAKWETCPKHGIPTFAATLWHEMAFTVDHETQLYAYVAETIPPTKRAAVLGRDHAKVMFQGQAVADIGKAPAIASASHVATARPTSAPAPTARFDEFIDGKPAAKLARAQPTKAGAAPRLRPSVRRLHDPADQGVAYRAR